MHPLAEDSASEQPQFVKAMRFTKAGMACAGRATGTLGPVCVPARASRAVFMRDGGGEWRERGGRRDMRAVFYIYWYQTGIWPFF